MADGGVSGTATSQSTPAPTTEPTRQVTPVQGPGAGGAAGGGASVTPRVISNSVAVRAPGSVAAGGASARPSQLSNAATIRAARSTPAPSVLGPVADPGSIFMADAPMFRPTFEIVPGGLGAGAPRTQQKVFRGDTLIFKADLPSAVPANVWMEGQVVGDTPATSSIDGNLATWRVVVGKMGVPAGIGEPASLVDAKPMLQLAPPLIDAGRQFTRSYEFRVVADLSWLSGQATTAGAKLNSAFLTLWRVVDQAYLNYDEAYQLHKAAVENHGRRKQLQNDILLGILLAGVGGAVGGAVAERIKTPAIEYLKDLSAVGSDGKLGGAAIATSIGDISKYLVRLGTVQLPSSTGQHGPDTPSPTSSPGTSKAAGTTPERWKALKEMELKQAAITAVDLGLELKKKMDEAWAQGRTDLMDIDPVQLVQTNVNDMTATIEVSSTKDYAIGLWRTWIRTYGITAIPNWAGGKTRTDELRGFFAFSDSKLYDDIHEQVGDALDDEVGRLRQETAPDPLTELPGS
jgi:hypothetical protein